MTAFKEGGWVRMTKDDWNGGYKSGDVFRLTGISERGVRFTDNDGDARYADHDSGRIEPWAPKVGERVRVPVEANSAWTGEGDVLEFHAAFGTYTIHMQTGYCAGESGDFLLKEIEPLPVAAEAQPEAQPAAPAPLTIQAGKFYKTRDGRKVGPVARNGDRCGHWYWRAPRLEGYEPYWCKNGDFYEGSRWHKNDLIAEWPSDTPTTNVAATVDALDEEYGPGVAVEKPKFKVGDRVRVTTSRHGAIQFGKTGTITYDNYDGDDELTIEIEYDTPLGSSGLRFNQYSVSDLEMIARPTPAIVCLIDNSSPLPATRPRLHNSIEAADKEAARLAGLHKGQEFGVFAMTGTPHKVEKTYEHEWQRLAASGEKIKAVKLLSSATGLDLHSARDAIDGWKRRAA